MWEKALISDNKEINKNMGIAVDIFHHAVQVFVVPDFSKFTTISYL